MVGRPRNAVNVSSLGYCCFRPARAARPTSFFCVAPSVAMLPNVYLALSRTRFCFQFVRVCKLVALNHRVKMDTPSPRSQRHGEEERRPREFRTVFLVDASSG